jgi:glutathione synthase/RimK-type ligase-like ATP-grasp enzyme
MKKIGILYGAEISFPHALIERINSKKDKSVSAEGVKIDKVIQARPSEYAVIIDRISHKIPFYRAFLKNAAICGAAVINNPFWWSTDEKFFTNSLAEKIGVPVPKTTIIPSNQIPHGANEQSLSNLVDPMDWEGMVDYFGFPALMKPIIGESWNYLFKVNSLEELYRSHHQTGQMVMMVQEEIHYNEYYHVFCIGDKEVKIVQYDPNRGYEERYLKGEPGGSRKAIGQIKDYALKINTALGYDFNLIEFAVKDGEPFAVDILNPTPDLEMNVVGDEVFEWVVENLATYAIKTAKAHKDGNNNLRWGEFMKNAVQGKGYKNAELKTKSSSATSTKEDTKTKAKQESKKEEPKKEEKAKTTSKSKTSTETKKEDNKATTSKSKSGTNNKSAAKKQTSKSKVKEKAE